MESVSDSDLQVCKLSDGRVQLLLVAVVLTLNGGDLTCYGLSSVVILVRIKGLSGRNNFSGFSSEFDCEMRQLFLVLIYLAFRKLEVDTDSLLFI